MMLSIRLSALLFEMMRVVLPNTQRLSTAPIRQTEASIVIVADEPFLTELPSATGGAERIGD